MKTFKIRCVTCQASLVVRDEALLGQIVACPRCESMVEVQRPASETTSAGEIDAADASSAEGVEEPAEGVSQETNAATTFRWVLAPKMLVPVAVVGLITGAYLLTGVPPTTPDPAELPATDGVHQVVPPSESESESEAVQQAPSSIAAVAPSPQPPSATPATPAEPGGSAQPVAQSPPAEPVAVEQPAAKPTETTDGEARATPQSAFDPNKRLASEGQISPLDFDPENFTLDMFHSQTSPHTTTSQAQTAISPRPATDTPQPPTRPDAPLRLSLDNSTNPQRPDAADRLKLPVPALRWEALPLVEFLQLISQLSGVPVSVSPEHLQMAGVTPQTPVSLQATDLTCGDALGRVLDPLRLEYGTDGPYVQVLRQGSVQTKEVAYPAEDLMDGATDTAEIVRWMQRLVAPTTWESAGGAGTLSVAAGKINVSQSQRVHFQILFFLERVRLARGLPPLSRFAAKHVRAASSWQLLAKPLRQPTTFTFSHDTPLQEVFCHWQTEMGIPILVDWPALGAQHLGPNTRVTCAVRAQPWRQVLTELLAPLGLDWRAAPGPVLEITSAEKCRNNLWLDVFPLTTEVTLPAVEKIVLTDSPRETQLLLDTSGHFLAVLGPVSVQRRVARWFIQHQHVAVPGPGGTK